MLKVCIALIVAEILVIAICGLKLILICASIESLISNSVIPNLDRVIKRISVLHNGINIKNPKPLGWITNREHQTAIELRKQNPEIYDYIISCLKLFLSKDD